LKVVGLRSELGRQTGTNFTGTWTGARLGALRGAFPSLSCCSADLRDVLPSIAITSGDPSISLATRATKRRWNDARQASREYRLVGRGTRPVPSRNGTNRRRSSIFFWPNRDTDHSFASGTRCEQAQQKDFCEWIGHFAGLPRSGKTAKITRKQTIRCAPEIPRKADHQWMTTDSVL
jgi:hypothetical protein